MYIMIDPRSRIPIYEQIEQDIVMQVQKGILKPNEQLPSLRQLSAQLSLNINTVKRAFSELEAKGVTYSVAGKGIFISAEAQNENSFLKDAMHNAEEAMAAAKALGASYEEMQALLLKLYKGENEHD